MRMSSALTRAIGVACVVVIAASCGAAVGSGSASTPEPASGAPSSPAVSAGPPAVLWPAPPDPSERAIEAGLELDREEFTINHAHSHLDVFIDGQEILVPAGIGIAIDDPEVKYFADVRSYGGIQMCEEPCISPLHTHDETGVLHTESKDSEPHSLGQFFTEWGVELSETCVGEHCAPTPIEVYIDGEPFDGDPATIALTDQKVIVIVVGTPPAEIPSTFDFSNA